MTSAGQHDHAITYPDQAELVRKLTVLVITAPPGDPVAARAAELLGYDLTMTADDLAARLLAALGMVPAGPLARDTAWRGAVVYDRFTDTHGAEVRVQSSNSSAGPRCWLFSGDQDTLQPAHVDIAGARRIRHALGAFITSHGEAL